MRLGDHGRFRILPPGPQPKCIPVNKTSFKHSSNSKQLREFAEKLFSLALSLYNLYPSTSPGAVGLQHIGETLSRVPGVEIVCGTNFRHLRHSYPFFLGNPQQVVSRRNNRITCWRTKRSLHEGCNCSSRRSHPSRICVQLVQMLHAAVVTRNYKLGIC